MDGGPNVTDALTAFGVDTRKANEGGKSFVFRYRHTKETKHGEVTYFVSFICILLHVQVILTIIQPTNAHFHTIVNADDGVLIAWYKYSPKYSPKYKGAEQNPPVTVLPKLKNWCDIAFLAFKHHATTRNTDIFKLRYIFSAPIHNALRLSTAPSTLLFLTNVQTILGRIERK